MKEKSKMSYILIKWKCTNIIIHYKILIILLIKWKQIKDNKSNLEFQNIILEERAKKDYVML